MVKHSAAMRLLPAALACALLGVTPSANAAATAYVDCPGDVYACLYDGPNGTGARLDIRTCGQRVELRRDWWDKIESARIVHASNVTLWSYYPNGAGGSELVLRGTRGTDVNAYAGNMADIIDCR
ncbi:peptidase inhibitor family I36 protein [Allokutzneria sp. NRRL B-24872]|uniref:peptidase inhibitor family I36 protein n=1 Tax=Allokutzneria sp. NRRL B-24872 TaxID=1137961 RepID=UPI000A387AD1|nr:peptidase inhibitor family I36 protein [Allokutzneria sp. NRRL B-24872]